MSPRRLSRALPLAALALCMMLAAGPCGAQGGDDYAAAASLTRELEQDRAHATVTASAIAQTKEALDRATRLRSAGDEVHAKAADSLAREWAETGRDLARAVAAEEKAADTRRKALEAQARLERSRALIEEGIAHLGRLRSELEASSRAAGKERTAVEEHDSKEPHDGKGSPVHSAPGE